MAREAVTLRALANYRNATEAWQEGAVFDTSREHAAWLERDSPGTFEVVEPEPPKTTRAKRKRVTKAPKTTAMEPGQVRQK